MARACLTKNGKAHTVEIGTTLSAALGLETPCGGHGRCGKCRVLAEGALSEVSEGERALLGEEALGAGMRLACTTRILGDCRVTLPDPARGGETVTLTEGLMPDEAHDPRYPGYLIAIDVGTTTLALTLLDPCGNAICSEGGGGWGRENPQLRFGGDVVTRMEAAMERGVSLLAASVREALDGLIAAALEESAVEAGQVGGCVITGNTVMLSLLAELDVSGMTRAPFAPPSRFGIETMSAALGLRSLPPDTPIALPPCIGAFLGADTVCAILGSGMLRAKPPALLADIGTNGEMVLWDGETLYACSTAAGPALEGGGISMGMRGGAGAIDRVSLCGGLLACHVIGEGGAKGICGSGLIDAVACMLRLGALEESGYLPCDPFRLTDGVTVSGRDIRMLQQAKGAICAGLETLLAHMGRGGEEMPLYLAGGFGAHLDPISAAAIGLIPCRLVPHLRSVGNAALSGAAMLALSRGAWDRAMALAGSARTVSLAGDPDFAARFIAGMLFPEVGEE